MGLKAIMALAAGLLTGNVCAGETDQPWPAPVSGWKAPVAGEHPRLFFGKAELAEIKRRAATPEGQAIVKRLRFLLDGKEGMALPEVIPAPGAGAPNAPHGKALTLWHPAGYGLLYHLTGDKLYAELGQRAMERILRDAGDIDPRYGFVRPNGALRAGSSLGAVAMGYDLCYDGKKIDFSVMAGPPKLPRLGCWPEK
jgi:hypothetical protein